MPAVTKYVVFVIFQGTVLLQSKKHYPRHLRSLDFTQKNFNKTDEPVLKACF